MGAGDSKLDWQEQYISTSLPTANPKHLKHKTTDQKCEMLTLPIISQDQTRYIERLTMRTAENRSKFITPLMKWRLKKDSMVCGSRQNLQIIFGDISPTLEDFLRYRKVINVSFTEQEILYIIRNIAYGLKDIQNMKEEHGNIDLSSICITNDVFLKDPMMLEEEMKLQPERKSTNNVSGYPSPQKLKSYYDSLSGFEELRGDLFSLGMVALQLYYSRQNMKELYSNPDPHYRNYTINLQSLNSKIQNIPFFKLRSAIEIMANFDSKKRLEIYDFLKGVNTDPNRLMMLKENFPLIGSQGNSGREIVNQIFGEKGYSDIGKVEQVNMSPQPGLKSEMFSSVPPFRVESYSEPYRPPGVSQSLNFQTFRQKDPVKTSQAHPSVLFNPTSKPDISSPLFAREEHLSSPQNGILSIKKDSYYLPESREQQQMGMTYHPSKQKISELTYTSKQPLSDPFSTRNADIDFQIATNSSNKPSKIPTFQQILNRVRANDPNSLLNKLPQFSSPSPDPSPLNANLPEAKLSNQPTKNINQGVKQQFLSYSAFERLNKPQDTSQYIPRSVMIKGSESIYHEERVEEKQVQRNVAKKEKEVQREVSDSIAQLIKGTPQNENDLETKLRNLEVEQDVEKGTSPLDQGINQAVSTVSAIPEQPENETGSRDSGPLKRTGESHQYYMSHNIKQSTDSIRIQQDEEPMSPLSPHHYPQEIKLFQNQSQGGRNIESKQSYRSIGSIKSDPKIVVIEPIEIEPVSPLKNRVVFVTEEYQVGTKYEGYMLDGMRHGKGKFFYKEGSYYDGEWKNNKMHGFGTLYYPDGCIAYQGEWKDDQFDGKGKVYNDQQRPIQGSFDYTDFNQLDDEWIKYEGDLKNDAKEGVGRLYLTNGDIYQGEFYRDMVHGVGVYRSAKSEKKGIWDQGKLKKFLQS